MEGDHAASVASKTKPAESVLMWRQHRICGLGEANGQILHPSIESNVFYATLPKMFSYAARSTRHPNGTSSAPASAGGPSRVARSMALISRSTGMSKLVIGLEYSRIPTRYGGMWKNKHKGVSAKKPKYKSRVPPKAWLQKICRM